MTRRQQAIVMFVVGSGLLTIGLAMGGSGGVRVLVGGAVLGALLTYGLRKRDQ